MALQNEQVAHKSLVDGSEINIHSHAGGGSGPVVKAGTITTDGAGSNAVVFGTAFADVNYAISLTPQDPSDAVMATYSDKDPAGFTVKTYEDKGQAIGSVTVDWIATPHSNP